MITRKLHKNEPPNGTYDFHSLAAKLQYTLVLDENDVTDSFES